jgi:hypothetical protein
VRCRPSMAAAEVERPEAKTCRLRCMAGLHGIRSKLCNYNEGRTSKKSVRDERRAFKVVLVAGACVGALGMA